MRSGLLALAALAMMGCQKSESAEQSAPAMSAAQPVQVASASGAMAGAPGGGYQLTLVQGKVLEKLDAANYTYLRLQTTEGEIWAAVTQVAVEVGADVTVENAAHMDGFESKTLNRKFDKIVFGNLKAPAAAQAGAQEAGAAVDKQAAVTQAHAGMSAPTDTGPISVEKAAGPEGKTVGEVFKEKQALKGKVVAVRGKVVKMNANIMGKTWIHVRDGSGKAEDDSNDLTVTTSGTAAVGDIVTVRGTLNLDRDIGAGYNYPVLLEDATVTP